MQVGGAALFFCLAFDSIIIAFTNHQQSEQFFVYCPDPLLLFALLSSVLYPSGGLSSVNLPPNPTANPEPQPPELLHVY
jgi:hypothetical protein